jgi:hypothetical protein
MGWPELVDRSVERVKSWHLAVTDVAARRTEAEMALSFVTDIRPLFREGDVECMKDMGVALDDPAWMCVAANAQSVYDAVASGSMPPDAPWREALVQLFKQWMDAGCPG